MPEAKLLTLEELKVCDEAYILHEKEDPTVHLYKRIKNYDDKKDPWIMFERQFGKWARERPCLFTEGYGKDWFAFDSKPSKDQVRRKKRYMKTYDEYWGSLYGTDSVP